METITELADQIVSLASCAMGCSAAALQAGPLQRALSLPQNPQAIWQAGVVPHSPWLLLPRGQFRLERDAVH